MCLIRFGSEEAGSAVLGSVPAKPCRWRVFYRAFLSWSALFSEIYFALAFSWDQCVNVMADGYICKAQINSHIANKPRSFVATVS